MAGTTRMGTTKLAVSYSAGMDIPSNVAPHRPLTTPTALDLWKVAWHEAQDRRREGSYRREGSAIAPFVQGKAVVTNPLTASWTTTVQSGIHPKRDDCMAANASSIPYLPSDDKALRSRKVVPSPAHMGARPTIGNSNPSLSRTIVLVGGTGGTIWT